MRRVEAGRYESDEFIVRRTILAPLYGGFEVAWIVRRRSGEPVPLAPVFETLRDARAWVADQEAGR